MMNTQKQNQLWRVDWYHRDGYRAPQYFVEAKTKKAAIKAAKEKSRFADFPKFWSFKLTKVSDEEED